MTDAVTARVDLRLGDWRVALADVECDLFCTDPPYGRGTHAATNDHIAGSALPDGAKRMAIAYQAWTEADVNEFVDHWSERTRGWMCCMTSDDLAPAYRAAFKLNGRYSFAPIPIIQPRPRLVGDGPASWTVWLMVARPKNREFATWGCLPGAYQSHTDRTGIVAGAKPLELMRAIVRDYSKPGDVVCDPCGGGFSTVVAAAIEGRHAVSSEVDPETFAKGSARVDRDYTHTTWNPAHLCARQERLAL